MKFTRNINDLVIVKLTQKGERIYTMLSPARDRLNNESVYDFTIAELMSIFAGNSDVFVDNKLVFPDPEKLNIYDYPLETFLEQELRIQ